jgi:hypothetical protein
MPSRVEILFRAKILPLDGGSRSDRCARSQERNISKSRTEIAFGPMGSAESR